jgi:hypothetical protein
LQPSQGTTESVIKPHSQQHNTALAKLNRAPPRVALGSAGTIPVNVGEELDNELEELDDELDERSSHAFDSIGGRKR